MPHASDHDLLARVRRGDQMALGELLKRHQKRLYNVCLRMVGNRDDAAELTQDTLLKIVEHISGFRADSQLTTWMVRIAMNQSISHLRKRRLRHTSSLDGPLHDGQQDDQAGALRQSLVDHREPRPDQRVQLLELGMQIQSALQRIDPDFRAALVLRDVEQMDYQQMAEVLEVPVGTVKSRLFRARLALRQQLSAADHHAPATPPPVKKDPVNEP